MDLRFNLYKAKFDILDKLTKVIFDSQRIERVNIFISLDDVYYQCKNSKVNREFECCGNIAPRQLVSNVLNLVAHYREWATRKGANVKVFAYYTLASIFENRTFLYNYREHYNDRSDKDNPDCYYVNSCIREGAGILSTITEYIESAYVIDTRGMEPSVFPLLCSQEFEDMNADWNFLITRDIFEFQYSYLPKFSVICPKGDNTTLITSGTLWEYIADKEKVSGRHLTRYPDRMFPVALAIVGDKKRSIPKVKGLSWRTIFNIMDGIIDENPDLDGFSYVSKLVQTFEDRKFDMNMISTNIDLSQVTANILTVNEVTKANIRSQLIDVPDYNNLLELNNRMDMFAACPINLRFLTRQNEVKSINPFKLNYS